MKNKKETMEKIKQAALEEFYEKGYAKASLRTICSRAGVTTGAMYFSFENKEALFRAILEPLVQSYEDILARCMQGDARVVRRSGCRCAYDAVHFKA